MKKRIPNILTLSRGLLVIIIIILFFLDPPNYPLILALFIVASLTDFFDGFLSRRWKAVSTFGVVFDPLFDKLLVLSLLLLLYSTDTIPQWMVIILFLRDLTTDVFKNYLLSHGVPVPAIKTAKIKTTMQMAAISLALLTLNWPQFELLSSLTWISAFLAVIFSVWSGSIYLKRFVVFFRQKKASNKID